MSSESEPKRNPEIIGAEEKLELIFDKLLKWNGSTVDPIYNDLCDLITGVGAHLIRIEGELTTDK